MSSRVQLRRTKGWRMPAGAMSVVRPGPWGNPFAIEEALETGFADNEKDARTFVVECFWDWLYKGDLSEWWFANGADRWFWMRSHLADLVYKDLACWCAPGEPCHADVLLKAAHDVNLSGAPVWAVHNDDGQPDKKGLPLGSRDGE